jgi:ATP-dependent Clp protease adaptor protein ClpS
MERMRRIVSEPEVENANQEQLTPRFNVVLLDDDDHTYEYVVEMLAKLFAYSETTAWNMATEVDTSGRSVIVTCELEIAEFGRDQIHAFGADWRMPWSKGPMSAVVEPSAA